MAYFLYMKDKDGRFATFLFLIITSTYIVASVYPLEKGNYIWLGILWFGFGFLLSYIWRKYWN